jgi:hypothetical protein
MTINNYHLHTAEESSPTADFLWLVVLALAGLSGSLVLACIAPFVALAVALAGTVRLAAALRAMTMIWLANQFVGFAFYHFPRTPITTFWGLAIGAAALLTTALTAKLLKRANALPIFPRIALGFVVAFAVYETGLFLAALFLGGIETFSPAIIAKIGLVNLLWLIGFVGLNELVALLTRQWLRATPRRLTKLA